MPSLVDLFIEDVETNPRSVDAWCDLGGAIVGGRVRVADIDADLSKADCFVRALEVAPTAWRPWVLLSGALGPTDTATVARVEVNKVECLWQASQLAPDADKASVWVSLGEALEAARTAHRGLTAAACFQVAASLSPRSAAAWAGLSRAVGDQATVEVDGHAVTRLECLARAAELDAGNLDRWEALGVALGPDERVQVGVEEVTQRSCFDRVTAACPSRAGKLAAAMNAPARAQQRATQEALEAKTAKVDELLAEVADLRRQRVEAKETIERQHAAIGELQRELATTKAALAEERAQHTVARDELAGHRKQVAEHDARAAEHERNLDLVVNARNHALMQVRQLELQLEALKAAAAAAPSSAAAPHNTEASAP